MKITKGQLKGWDACRDGYEWFLRRFPVGEAEYQDVLNALAEDDRPSDASWLLNKTGPDRNAVIEIEAVIGCKHFFAAGAVIVRAGVNISGRLIAGTDIEAGEDIKAGTGIKAGRGIEAGWDIEAGRDIEAGTGIKAGRGIEAGTGIKAGRGIEAGTGIKAGWGIEAGWDIKAGDDFAIAAGLRLRLSSWSVHAKVIAKSKPTNLVSGFWVEQNTEQAAKELEEQP